MAKYVNRRPYPGENNNVSGKYASAASRGQPLGAHASNAGEFALAGGSNFIGFLTRDVTADGPVLADHVYPGRLDLPFKAGDEVTLEKADEVDVGSDFLVTSGTGAITTSTARGTKLSFDNGKWREAQSGDVVYYTLSDQLTPEDGETVRIRAERA